MEPIARIIRDVRKQLGLTQEEFAHGLGLTISTINRWEKSHAKPSKLARLTLTRFAGGRGVYVPDFVGDPDPAFGGSRGVWSLLPTTDDDAPQLPTACTP